MTVETLPRSHALSARADLTERTGGLVTVEEFQTGVSLRVPPGPGAAVVAGILGADLPVKNNTWTCTERGRAVWLGPDEWLVTEPAVSARGGLDLETTLRTAVAPFGGTAVDVSAQRVGLRLAGPHARAVLAKGCSIDVHPRSFAPNACAQTTLGQAGVVLLSLGSTGDAFTLLVRSSFAGYLADWLVDATLEFRS
ncbi:sarcosine oxidase subunit gamma [Kineococcus sp. R86509]|uniref:sarcosine oxidase subunit gamma n=1 Tax=Kineococcus sp. R86509 TaxID=3093851 RepID=UPI0036D2777A